MRTPFPGRGASIKPHLCLASTSPTRLLTPASGGWQVIVSLHQMLDICAADRCDGLFHSAAARSVFPHTAASCAEGFPLDGAYRRRCCCLGLAYRGWHKALRLTKDTDWQALGPLALSIPFAALRNSLLFAQLLYPANAAESLLEVHKRTVCALWQLRT